MSDPILELLQGIRPEEDYTSSQDYFVDGLLDSLDLITLVSALDRRYGISIRGVDIVPENFHSLTAIRALLARHGVST
jgi:acyl carrier protein